VLHEDDILHLLGQLHSPAPLGVIIRALGWICITVMTDAATMIPCIAPILAIANITTAATTAAAAAAALTLGVEHQISDCRFQVHALPVPCLSPKGKGGGEGEGCVTSLCDRVGQTAHCHHRYHIYRSGTGERKRERETGGMG
jgi:hypothetical protein